MALAVLLVPFTLAYGADPPRPVDLSLGHAVGTRFHLEGMSENIKRRHVSAASDQQPDLNLTTTVSYSYDVEVLSVEAGRSTKQRCRITKLTVNDGTETRSLIEGSPTVLVSVNEQGFTKIDVERGSVSEQALGGLYHVIHLEDRRVTPEMLVGSPGTRSVGDEWSIAAPMATDYLGERDLDVEPESVSGTAQFVGTSAVDGTPCDEFAARLSSKRLRLGGVLPDGMQLTSATVDVGVRVFAPRGKSSPILRESTNMTVLYSGRGNPSGITITADHTAQMRETWTRTPLGE